METQYYKDTTYFCLSFYEPDYQPEEPPLKKSKTTTTTTEDSVELCFEFSYKFEDRYEVHYPNGETETEYEKLSPFLIKTFFLKDRDNFKYPNNLQGSVATMLTELGIDNAKDNFSSYIRPICLKACDIVKSCSSNRAIGIKIKSTQVYLRYEESDVENLSYEESDVENLSYEESDVETSEMLKMIPTSEKAINELEKIGFDGGDSIINKECTICFDDFEMDFKVLRLPCFHGFHEDCITTWLRKSHVCPTCRFKMPVYDDSIVNSI